MMMNNLNNCGKMMENDGNPLVNQRFANWKMAIEIVSFLMNSMVIFHTYVNVYQRVVMVLRTRAIKQKKRLKKTLKKFESWAETTVALCNGVG